jgi:ABC-type transport system substrate-binding protein
MRRLLALLLIPALALIPSACRKEPEGTIKVIAIGGEPKMRDPASGPLATPDAVLLTNVGQGLVRFDASGNIVGGLAERWNLSDDGVSYIFRLASAEWPDGKKITAEQVAKILQRDVAPRSRNPIKDTLGAIDDIVAMTDRVIEIRLTAPRPSLLALLAQPEMGVVRGRFGTGPFSAAPDAKEAGWLRLTRKIAASDDEETQTEEVLLTGTSPAEAVKSFASGNVDLVLGGTFADLPIAQRTQLPRNSIRFDPASGLFGLMPLKPKGGLDNPEVRRLLSQTIDRTAIISSLGVPGLAPRATVLEAGLDGMGPPTPPAWLGTPIEQRRAAIAAEAARLFGKMSKPEIHVLLPEGPGADLVLRQLASDWGALGFAVMRASGEDDADFRLIDEVAPSSSAAWFVRHFRCGAAPICDPDADQLMDAARQSLIPQQRVALLQQAAVKIDDDQLFISIAAPVRWSLVSGRIQGFSGNRFAVHTLTGLEQRPANGD